MKINEVITEKERVDEVLPAVIGAGVHAARLAAPHVLRYGKKAWDMAQKGLPYLKKAKGASHGLGSKAHMAGEITKKAGEIGKKVGPKVHAAGEVGKKIVKKSPPTPGDGSELAKTAMVPGPQSYHKQAPPKQVARPKSQGKMSPAASAAIAQAQQAQRNRKRP